MRLFFLIIASIISCNISAQKYFGRITGATSGVPVLVVFAGESNSGGLAANSYATSGELSIRTLPIWDNINNDGFDFLDIGTNNLLGHAGNESYSSTAHGAELQLANRYDDGDFGDRTVYLCKAGQGGTTIAAWMPVTGQYEGIYPYEVFIQRVSNAIIFSKQ